MGGADCIPVLIGRLSETARRNGAIDIEVIYERCMYIFLNVTWEKENVWNGEIIRIECEIISNVCICYYNIVEKLSSYCFRERRKRRFRIKIYDLLIS